MLNPRFATPGTLSLVLQQAAVDRALAVGQTLIILTAGIDLSVGAITILAMMVMAEARRRAAACPASLAVAASASASASRPGCSTALLVTRLKLPPFIVTLGTLSIFTAHRAALLRRPEHPGDRHAGPAELDRGGHSASATSGSPRRGAWSSLLYVVVGFALCQTAWGRHVYAVGDDPEAARLAGIRVNRVLLSVYAVGRAHLRPRGLDPHRPGRRGQPQRHHRRQPREHHRRRHRRHQPVRWSRGADRHRCSAPSSCSSSAAACPWRASTTSTGVLAIGVLVIVAVAVDQWIRKVRA